MLIANPIYDVVFKYLLDDERVAKLLLSALLGETVEALTYRATEHRLQVGGNVDRILVVRLDFQATLRLGSGKQRLVLIELQKARSSWDLMRFRRYLGGQYASSENVFVDGAGRRVPLPIVSIYFLGTSLEHTDATVVRVNRLCRDAVTGESVEPEQFIESLNHESLIVQVPKFRGRRRNELETLLSIFDQDRIEGDRHHLRLNEDELPERYREVVRRLVRAIAEPKVVEEMDIEDEVVEALHEKDRQLEEKDRALAAQRAELAAQQAELAAQQAELAAKDDALTAKDDALAEAQRRIAALEAKVGVR